MTAPASDAPLTWPPFPTHLWSVPPGDDIQELTVLENKTPQQQQLPSDPAILSAVSAAPPQPCAATGSTHAGRRSTRRAH